MVSHDPPSFTLINRHLSDVPTTQPPKQGKDLNRRKGSMSSVEGVSHASRRFKRRLLCNLLFWKWKKSREKCRFWKCKAKRRERASFVISSSPNPSLPTQSQKHKGKFKKCHPQNLEKEIESPSSVGCDTPGGSEDRLDRGTCLQKQSKLAGLSELCTTAGPLQNSLVTEPNFGEGATNQNAPTKKVTSPRHRKQSSVQLCELAGSSELCHTTKPLQAQSPDSDVDMKLPKTVVLSQRDGGLKLCELVGLSEQCTTITPLQDQATNRDNGGIITCAKMLCKTVSSHSQHQADVSQKTLTKDIYEFLGDFYRIYGSFIPLQKSDVLRHLKRKFNIDFDERNVVLSEVTRYQAAMVQTPISSFRVVYKKHTLTLDDLSTLADQNWLNDQVMNMYGELIMESSQHKVHFLNSFFHRQLVTKGYEGVKRWTKQVDLFSKSLLLVPIHLEVHWCLVTADIVKKRICLYDSQGNMLQKVARNILKYLMTEAQERQQAGFQDGWTVSFSERIPQQTNENDCGVFVLEYCRCLALAKPLHFSQNDIPEIRKRIYKELCDCKLSE